MNNFGLSLTPSFSIWLIALIAPLFIFILWKEVRRNQRFLPWRILAQLLVLVSILGILLRPGFTQEKKSTSILLLTPGYTKTQVDSLIQVNSSLRLLKLPGVEYNHDSEVLTSDYDLQTLSKEIQFVAGEGLSSSTLELMPEKHFQFLPSQPPSGITQLSFPNKAKANQVNLIQGTINTNEKIPLTLIGPGGGEDSVTINKTKTFALKFTPKLPGLFVYTIRSKTTTGIQTEQLPIEVIEEQKLNILFLQKSPGFELRQLKNFLAEKGHHLALRYQLSKNNERVEFATMAPVRITPLTSSILQTFDLIIIDNDALESLSPREKNILEQSVHEGIGMILLLKDVNKINQRFLPIETKKELKDAIHLSLVDKQYTLPVVPLSINESPALYPVQKSKGKILSAYMYSGLGKVGVQLLQETYRIALEGNNNDYAKIWSPLLEKTARSKTEKFKIQLPNPFPIFPDQSLSPEVISSVDEHPVLLDDQLAVPLTEHVSIDNLWVGKTWAGNAGWHQFSANGVYSNYFVSEPDSWNSLRVANQLKENKKVAVTGAPSAPEHTIYHRKTIPLVFFFLLFIFASGYLWLAPKL